ncbi:metallophosphoesterase family protein [Vulcanisaeta distributa]|uniref:Metallophosphoesterase n=1 Tax=Vulcanisaeta distributa (strain DSM 14429 / JCM 11212 / NBRC 100878 / IC-017) TaxID=572478 RepID=E1QRE0_VULDI|nr:metallophosphoesterase [Vulcanisaeta distributa]ADN50637.1 metallophosphoesterase [Vulcanisaeta distributa DSM 14429]
MSVEEFRGITVDSEDGERWLLIADTHVGLEVELGKKGVRIPSQSARIAQLVLDFAERAGATSLAILGDVKHEIASIVESAREVREFLDRISGKFNKVVLVKGNHDGNLDLILSSNAKPNVYLIDSRGFMIRSRDGKNLLLLHGNSKPRVEDFMNADVIIMGHTHPAILIQDVTGYVMRAPVIVKVRVDKSVFGKNMYNTEVGATGTMNIIVLPTFNPLTVGMDVFEIFPKDLVEVETILHYARTWEILSNIEVYLTDMTYLGTMDILARIREEISEGGYDVSWL